jgi:hypothetical protein
MNNEKLIGLNNLMNVKHTFEPGQLVEWKPGLCNRRSDGPFVVSEVLEEPISDVTLGPGSPYFGEPLDLVVGSIDCDGDYMLLHQNSRRLQPVS